MQRCSCAGACRYLARSLSPSLAQLCACSHRSLLEPAARVVSRTSLAIDRYGGTGHASGRSNLGGRHAWEQRNAAQDESDELEVEPKPWWPVSRMWSAPPPRTKIAHTEPLRTLLLIVL